MRIVLGDGQRLFIDAMAAALTANGATVTAVATSPAEVLAAIGRHRPDLCLLATRFNGHDSFDLLDMICRRHPQIKIVMLADIRDPAASSEVLSAGAAGLIRKDQHLIEIMRILADVLAGEQLVDTELTQSGGNELNPRVPSDSSWLARLLTLRERNGSTGHGSPTVMSFGYVNCPTPVPGPPSERAPRSGPEVGEDGEYPAVLGVVGRGGERDADHSGGELGRDREHAEDAEQQLAEQKFGRGIQSPCRGGYQSSGGPPRAWIGTA